MSDIDDLAAAIDSLRHMPDPAKQDVEQAERALWNAAVKAFDWVSREVPQLEPEISRIAGTAIQVWNYHGIGPWLVSSNPRLGGQMPVEVLMAAFPNPVGLADAIFRVSEAAAQDLIAGGGTLKVSAPADPDHEADEASQREDRPHPAPPADPGLAL